MLKEELGAEYVLNSSLESFEEEFKALAKKLNATVALDCIGGEFTGTLLENMPSKSIVYFYGALSGKACSNINALTMIGRNQKLQGWILGEYIADKGMGMMGVMKTCKQMMANSHAKSDVQAKFPLSNFRESYE